MNGRAAASGRWLTLANLLTGLRLLAAPLLASALWGGHALGAAVLFWAAVASDLADGRIARRRGEASSLGGLLDHATDATFVAAGLAALAAKGVVPALLPVLVAAAFVQYTLDSRALRGRPLRASGLGRWNGIAYFVLLGTPITRDLLGIGWPGETLVALFAWLLVATTLASMADRGWAALAAVTRGRRRRGSDAADR